MRITRARWRAAWIGAGLILLAPTGFLGGLWYRAGSVSFLRVVRSTPPPGDYEPREKTKLAGSDEALERLRAEALTRAKVWRTPAVPIERADLGHNLDRDFAEDADVFCHYLFEDSAGYSPKFDCVLAGGEIVRVKYGLGNAEVFAEVAATRLLATLGFGADSMSVVKSVRCSGCPAYPYPRLGGWWNRLLLAKDGYREFGTAAIERPMDGTALATSTRKGWRWDELDRIEPARGGASLAETDAFRLTAVFLAHWDNKSENQRLVCLDRPEKVEDGCSQPLAMIHDAGSTFGPRSLDLAHWRESPIWSDRAACRVSMRSMPYEGATFPEAPISDSGRRWLAERLNALSREQVRALFAGARFAQYAHASTEERDIERWTDAFEKRAKEIAEAGPCPAPDELPRSQR